MTAITSSENTLYSYRPLIEANSPNIGLHVPLGVRVWELIETTEKSKLHPSKVSTATYGNGRFQECVNTEFVCEFKQGFVIRCLISFLETSQISWMKSKMLKIAVGWCIYFGTTLELFKSTFLVS